MPVAEEQVLRVRREVEWGFGKAVKLSIHGWVWCFLPVVAWAVQVKSSVL
jgi:hypothetical protein